MKKLISAANNHNDSAYNSDYGIMKMAEIIEDAVVTIQQTGLDNLSDSEKGYLERAIRKMYELSDTINDILH